MSAREGLKYFFLHLTDHLLTTRMQSHTESVNTVLHFIFKMSHIVFVFLKGLADPDQI